VCEHAEFSRGKRVPGILNCTDEFASVKNETRDSGKKNAGKRKELRDRLSMRMEDPRARVERLTELSRGGRIPGVTVLARRTLRELMVRTPDLQ